MTDYAKVVAFDPDVELLDMYGTEGPIKGVISPNNLGEMGFMRLDDAIVAQDAGLVGIKVHHETWELELAADGELLGREPPGVRPFPSPPPTLVDLPIGGVGTTDAWIDMLGGPSPVAGLIRVTIEVGPRLGQEVPIPNIPDTPFLMGQDLELVAHNIADNLDGLEDESGQSRRIVSSSTGPVVTISEARGGLILVLTAVAILS